MQVGAFALCESARALGEGRIKIEGEIREFVIEHLPAISSPVSLAIVLTFRKPEAGKRTIKFAINDATGKDVCHDYEFAIGIVYDWGQQTSNPVMLVPTVVLKFYNPGGHTARLFVDGREVATWPFVVTSL